MEAIDYFKEAKRMCISYPSCKGCPLRNFACGFIRCIESFSDADMQCQIKVVEQWSKEHHFKTNAQKFEEVFGFNGNTVNKVKPEIGIAGTKGSCGYDDCRESCGSRHFPRCPMWWNDEFKEPEHEYE